MSQALLQDARRAHQAGDLERAARLYRQILDADDKNFDALYLLAFVHLQSGQWEHAERLLGDALSVNPRVADAWYNRGRALLRLGRPGEALSAFDRALDIQPNIPEILLHRGNALWGVSRAGDALASYDHALAIKPDFPEAWHDRGNALSALNRLDEALASYSRVLAARPGDAVTLYHRALTLFDLKRFEEASSDFAKLLEAKPDFPYARGNLVHSNLSVCDWRGFEKQRAEVAARLNAGQRVVTPIQNAAFSSSLDDHLHAARIWAADKYPRDPLPMWHGEMYRHDRIRIAYLSADFHSHATAALMAGVFESHDRVRFQTVAVSFGPDDRSEMRARLIAAFDRFADVREDSDSEIAMLLRQMEIDIAIDLKGYTQDSRPGILAHRPAPVQVNYLGFPGTMGADYIDYIIADPTIIPPEHESFYTEKIARLPDTYQGNDAKRRIAEDPPTRAEAGLPERGFVFCCFNNNFKILPEMFAIWMRLLISVEGSVLWLLQDNAAAARNLKREAAAHGIAPDRLIFAKRANYDVHLARHRLADLFLDTLPYNAHTSASDALWAGLPIITCLGSTFAGRVAASLMKAVGLPELIAHSLEGYESLALNLARDPLALSAIKSRLVQNRSSHPLFDTVRFTRNLESAYAAMWQRHANGLPPISFTVGNASRADETDFQALYSLALVHFRQRQFEDASRLAGEAITLDPVSAEAHFLKGSALKNLKRYDAALECFERALSAQPGYVEAQNNRGVIFLALKRYAEALACFDDLTGDRTEAGAIVSNNRAAALLGLKRYPEALAACETSLAVMPERADTLSTYGAVQVALGRDDEALVSFAKALAIDPNNADAARNRADTLLHLRRYEEAAQSYEHVLRLDPDSPYARGNLAMCRLYCCDWRSLADDRPAIAVGLRAGRRVLQPYGGLMLSASAAEQLQAARIWVADGFKLQAPLWHGERYRHSRIRVAYVSGDLNAHTIAFQMAGVFEHHDRTDFEPIAISFGSDDKSPTRARLEAAFDRFIDVQGKDDFEIARILKELEIDIAVDLMGFTGACRPGIFAYRPAPVQVNYLGFPGTMGADYIDYIIADPTIIPSEHESFYTEKIARLPDTYQGNDAKRRNAEDPPTRAEAGLPERGFVFCCFNNNFKILPEMFAIWMRLLVSVEESVLWLLEDNAAAARNLKREAAAHGIAPDRLIFAPRANYETHLARHRLADLFLDTLPYNAHTSASDALWAGLPMVTCLGSTFAGRVAASLLKASGLPELVTDSLERYETLALKLARDPPLLSAFKSKLAQNRGSHPLFDTARFTRNLEKAYAAMSQRHAQGLLPVGFAVASLP